MPLKGDINAGKGGVAAEDGAVVTVNGNVTGGDGNRNTVDFSNPTSCSNGSDGVYAIESEVTVTGDVKGGTGYGTCALGGNASSNVQSPRFCGRQNRGHGLSM